MEAIPKIIGLMCCSVVLYLGLSGHAVSAADKMNVSHAGDRTGGQAGQGSEHVNRGHAAALNPDERIGGQAGQGYEPETQEQISAPHPGERIGGQAGHGYEQKEREHLVAYPGERIGGQAGLGETRVMSK